MRRILVGLLLVYYALIGLVLVRAHRVCAPTLRTEMSGRAMAMAIDMEYIFCSEDISDMLVVGDECRLKLPLICVDVWHKETSSEAVLDNWWGAPDDAKQCG